MFVIIWGTQGDMVRLSPFGEHECANCARTRKHSYFLVYEYFHMWFIFGSVKSRRYYIACNRCKHGVEVHPSDVPEQEPGAPDPIPFMHRKGCLVGAVVLPLGAALLALGYMLVESLKAR